jgi:hypothetical protein
MMTLMRMMGKREGMDEHGTQRNKDRMKIVGAGLKPAQTMEWEISNRR